MEYVLLLFITPLLAIISLSISNHVVYGKIQAVFSVVMFFAAVAMAYTVVSTGAPIVFWDQAVYVDGLSALNVLLISLVGALAAIYSKDYMETEFKEKLITKGQLRFYYLFFYLFIISMFVASVVNNLGLLWVGIELTTLISALLVAFYGKQYALEAAWKYLIMGSVGISFALLGIIFIYISSLSIEGHQIFALQWTELCKVASQLDPHWFKIGFVLVLIGFGTKAGLAPMHFWLPDAHSQAPSPISAVLSGVLLNTALYGLFRVYTIANMTITTGVAEYLIIFGLISVAVTVPFITVQSDLKRMLAYSSVEHMGIITLGIGIGGPIGIYGALLHMFNHSLTKSLLFFSAGVICHHYHTKQMQRITGLLKTMPIIGGIFLLSAFAIAGSPPFSIFMSELMILIAGFKAGYLVVTILFAVLIVLIFAGMMYYIVRMVFGTASTRIEKIKFSPWIAFSLFVPLTFVILCGFHVPNFLNELISAASSVIQQGVVK
ncbi:hydrogenase 4 subunit F [Selenomonadales bacterium OttesenSCG-928-I06]|nr:hydrogenase 4 subunit F [Selenomonadales bacterium OttesenSCG-928-I06]